MKDKEFEKEAEKRGYTKRRTLDITFNLKDFLYCDKCGAPVDEDGNYCPD